jgi:hypothetical protein
MAKDATIKKDLEFRRSLLTSALEWHLPALFDSAGDEGFAVAIEHLGCDPKS